MQSPNFIILYVDNPAASAAFYADLIGQQPIETSSTFVLFALDNGLKFGLWSLPCVEPKAAVKGGGGEIIFTVSDKAFVDSTYEAWRWHGLKILQKPTQMDFGYTFVALDPDEHRLRVYAPAEAGQD